MHLFMIDETNKNFVSGDFLVVGGLVFSDSQVGLVHSDIETIRVRNGYKPQDSLKFQTSARPKDVSVEAATQAKREVIESLVRREVRLIVYVLLHDIGKNQAENVRMAYAINTLAGSYHRLLRDEKSNGIFLIDRDDKQYPVFEEGFRHGIGGGNRFPISDRIHLFGQTANGASHLTSAVDIALGGFRFCVNQASRGEQMGARSGEVARDIFAGLSTLMWGRVENEKKHVGGRGYIERPQEPPRVDAYRVKYGELRQRLSDYGSSPQEV